MTAQDYAASWTAQDEAAGFIGKAIGTINGHLDTINTETQALLSTWNDSESQTEYNRRQSTWTAAATEIVRVLESFKTSMNKVAGVSSDTEKAAAKGLAI
ncbi:MAG: hypothetical protein M3400_13430 [Actinomycetota bacterium]|nr:hypothetical protein [Actinomycetota bacterium]